MRKNVLLGFGTTALLAAGLLLPAQRAAAAPAVVAAQPVMMMDASGNIVGDAVGVGRLTREDGGISFELTTSRLMPLGTYTAWWMLFTPDNKVHFVGYAGGAVALPNGTASLSGRLAPGPLPAIDGRTVMVATPGGMFDNPQTVKLAIVLREHGPIRLESLAEQLTTFNGGCPPNTCLNVQMVNFAP